MSFKNMMVAPHHLASKVGADILKEGGNAVEAMIASAAMISVVYPHMNSMGGDNFWLISIKPVNESYNNQNDIIISNIYKINLDK